jgi:hypothetical protein
MLSTTEKGTSQRGNGNSIVPLAGLRADVIRSLEATFPRSLSEETRWLLGKTCGLIADGFGSIDFTGQWHPEEPLGIFRPCLTLAIDDDGRRWIAETWRRQGLPGPVWCVLSEPAVAVYVSDDLTGFVTMLDEGARLGCVQTSLRSVSDEARIVWANRQRIARQSREQCREDAGLRGWLAGLPFDARVYDLRTPGPTRGWPYGLAGPEGRLYRCGRLPVFAVAAGPSAGRWSQYMAQIGASSEPAGSAIAHSRLKTPVEMSPSLARGTATGSAGSRRRGSSGRSRRVCVLPKPHPARGYVTAANSSALVPGPLRPLRGREGAPR